MRGHPGVKEHTDHDCLFIHMSMYRCHNFNVYLYYTHSLNNPNIFMHTLLYLYMSMQLFVHAYIYVTITLSLPNHCPSIDTVSSEYILVEYVIYVYLYGEATWINWVNMNVDITFFSIQHHDTMIHYCWHHPWTQG